MHVVVTPTQGAVKGCYKPCLSDGLGFLEEAVVVAGPSLLNRYLSISKISNTNYNYETIVKSRDTCVKA